MVYNVWQEEFGFRLSLSIEDSTAMASSEGMLRLVLIHRFDWLMSCNTVI